jgi:hypothetical protein
VNSNSSESIIEFGTVAGRVKFDYGMPRSVRGLLHVMSLPEKGAPTRSVRVDVRSMGRVICALASLRRVLPVPWL